jgi:hypothetical protein
LQEHLSDGDDDHVEVSSNDEDDDDDDDDDDYNEGCPSLNSNWDQSFF